MRKLDSVAVQNTFMNKMTSFSIISNISDHESSSIIEIIQKRLLKAEEAVCPDNL